MKKLLFILFTVLFVTVSCEYLITEDCTSAAPQKYRIEGPYARATVYGIPDYIKQSAVSIIMTNKVFKYRCNTGKLDQVYNFGTHTGQPVIKYVEEHNFGNPLSHLNITLNNFEEYIEVEMTAKVYTVGGVYIKEETVEVIRYEYTGEAVTVVKPTFNNMEIYVDM